MPKTATFLTCTLAAHRAALAAAPSRRKTPLYPCERRRVAREKQARARRIPRKQPGACYTTESYSRAVKDGIGKARRAGVKVPDWSINQIRHARATEVRRAFGLEGAQVALGHRHAQVTQIYAERDLELARTVARKSG